MTKPVINASIFALIVAGLCSSISAFRDPRVAAAMAGIVEPGGTPADATLAETNPDQYAWELFAYLVRQAQSGAAGVADPNKLPFHEQDDTDGVWETWALASSAAADAIDDKSEVFLYDGSRPARWNQLNRSHETKKILSPGLTAVPAKVQAGGITRIALGQLPPDPNGGNQEVRINQATFDTIVSNHLYSQEGIQASIATALQNGKVSFVSFPGQSKEIKAAWIRLRACDNGAACLDKGRYHWRNVQFGASTQVWGLAALHIMTKDLSNWFWADFIHVDCESKVGACAGYATGYVSPKSSDSTPHDAKPKSNTYGTRWQNYHLRGTQTGFLKNGQNAELSNPVLETFSNPTSCMTCHAYASAGSGTQISGRVQVSGQALPNAGIDPSVGVPPLTSSYIYIPAGISEPNTNHTTLMYLQADFEWAMTMNAQHEIATHTPVVHHPTPGRKSSVLSIASASSNSVH
jgi:hypothetical protein